MSKFLHVLEEYLAMTLFAATVILVLFGAIGRSTGSPQTWSVDMAQVLFAWCCMFGADIALKKGSHIVIDIAVVRMPKVIQVSLSYLWNVVIVIFLGLLVYLGYQLTVVNMQREIGDLGVSYAWVNASVPVGASLMLITTLLRLTNFVTGKELPSIHGHDGDAL